MSVHRRKDRKNTYQVVWREPGSGQIKRKNFSGPNAQHDAEVYDQEIKLQKLKNPAQLIDSEPGPDLNKVLSLYLSATRPHKSVRSIHNELLHIQPFINLVGDVPIDKLGPEHMQKVKKDHFERGNSIATFRRRWNIVRAALNWAVNEGYIETNPLRNYQVKNAPQLSPILPPSPQEIHALLQVAAPHLQRVILLTYYTGARPGPSELFGLRWETVDLTNGWIQLLSAAKETSGWRPVPIHEELDLWLRQWMEMDSKKSTPWVIHYRGKPVGSIKKAWHKAKKDAQISRRIRPYDLRHAFVSSSLDAGADLQAISAVAGHSNVKTTLEHYRHIKSEMKRSAVSRLPGLQVGVQSGDTKAPKKGQNEGVGEQSESGKSDT